jgi:hypothetical protein
MAEYVMSQGESAEDVAKELMEHAGDRGSEIQVFPRPNVPGGQVFEIPDDLADGFVSSRLSRIGNEPDETTTQDEESAASRRTSRAEARRAAKAAEGNKE